VPPSEFGNFPIHAAASNGHLYIVRRFARGETSLQNSRFGWTPLHVASSCGRVDIVKYLLDEIHAEVDPKAIDRTAPETVPREEALCMTPLIFAIMGGQEDVAKLLIQHGADIQARTSCGATTLQIAIDVNLPTLVDELLSRGESAITHTSDNNTSLHSASVLSTPTILQKLLPSFKKDSTFNINQQTESGYTALMWACKPGCDENRRLLLEEGADVLLRTRLVILLLL
jgi:ankyrin repeat protein